MLRPAVLAPTQSVPLAITGGLAATILLSSAIYSAPAFGLPFIDIPGSIGGIFASNAAVAFWLGYALFFLAGAFIFGPLLALIWPMLPGDAISFRGAFLKGLLFGAGLWILMGLLLAILGALNRTGAEVPGFFALRAGVLGAVVLLAAHLAYGVAVALITAMGRGIKPLDTLGWMSHHPGDVHDVALTRPRQAGI